MKLVIFGLTISSSWGNGHATLWRGLCRALLRRGHRIVFYERDVPYYREHRDLAELPNGGRLVLYPGWEEVAAQASEDLADADVALVTSYCPDGVIASERVLDSRARQRVFYDLDTPVTLARLAAGESVAYIGPSGLGGFDLVLSYTGGTALEALKTRLGARRVAPLYGGVDPEAHRPDTPQPQYRASLSYHGTYAADRQAALEALFVEPARRMPERRFVIGGAQYPHDFPWAPNIHFVRHLSPAEHPSFFSSSSFTLHVSRRSMAAMGFCPSGRMFEAAACGAPIISDGWVGLDSFLEPGAEIVVVRSTEEVMAALDMSEGERLRLARSARERVLEEHTLERRARRLLDLIQRLPARDATVIAEA